MKTLIVANWKMNPTTLEGAKLLFEAVKKEVKNIKKVEIVICPPFTFLSNIQYPISNIKLGAQDCFWEEKGAFTGEISPLMLKNLGCEYIIIGHSERRKLGETDEMINKKIKAVITAKLKPILCIGETEKERRKGKTLQVLKNQLRQDLKGIENCKLESKKISSSPPSLHCSVIENLIIAYEPVWAIGTGNPCSSKEAKKVFLFLQKFFGKVPVLYGGSVDSENAASYIHEANFQGLLVGGASLNPKEFIKIIKSVAQSCPPKF